MFKLIPQEPKMGIENIQYIELDKLNLDLQNPRLPLSFKKEHRDEKSIINWLLKDASLIELMLAIGKNDYFIGESLLVIENKMEGEYTVVEGNRRLASLKLLNTPKLAKIHTRKIQKVLDETDKRPTHIPCIIFPSRDNILQYLGYRHITGVKSWGVLPKARYATTLLSTLSTDDPREQYRELAKIIGSRSDYIKKILVSYEIYLEIEDNGFYEIPGLNETTFYFNYITDSLSRRNIRSFIGIDMDLDKPTTALNHKNLKVMINWFFRKNENNHSTVLGNSTSLGMLNDILGHEGAKESFMDGATLKDAYVLISVSPDEFHNNIYQALRILKHANTYLHKVAIHHSTDKDVLKEISILSKTMAAAIDSKDSDTK